VPYVKCPSCLKIGYTAPIRFGPSLCPRCGELLPPRRSVVPISRYRRLAAPDATARPESAEALEAA
jgi:hypothetical protein